MAGERELMQLKRLVLRNIRSYTDAAIDFPQGSVLLAGDIGSGKSTILLAVEFALFGIKASELPGSSLLRHGKREGSVELVFSIDGRDILIKRVLKQAANGIVQDAGYLIRDGVKKDATPKELRALVFEILGYPKDLVGKSKDLIYRYTVYTPQEAMKEILTAKKEERLDILRRVFNVDKYKRIRENSVIVLGALKERRKELEGFSANLPEKKREREELEEEQRGIAGRIAELQPALGEARKMAREKAAALEKAEKEAREAQLLRRELAGLEARMGAILEQRKRNAAELERTAKEILVLENETQGRDIADHAKGIMERMSALQSKEKELRAVHQSVSSLLTKKEQSEDTARKVMTLDDCPLCRQRVAHSHKEAIAADEARKQKEWDSLLVKEKQRESEITGAMGALQKEADELRKRQGEAAALRVKLQTLGRRRQDRMLKEGEQESLKKEIGQISVRKLDLILQLGQKKAAEEGYQSAKEEVEKARGKEQKAELEHLGMKKELEGVQRLLAVIGKDIREKSEAVEKLKRLRGVHEWLSAFFMNLMLTMERHVMLQINKEFSELFRNWFSTLMEDEMLSVRLDDEFTPLIEQDGYETSIDNLSGGEKTSVALSYRLALNRVINDVVAEIKTRDILMLDEPTDGFSTEQLDKVREVLETLRIGQVIIVSHEAKIESFVDNVIRIAKQDHVSRVVV